MRELAQFFEATEEYLMSCRDLPAMAIIDELATNTETYAFFNLRNLENMLSRLYETSNEKPTFSALKILVAASEYALLKMNSFDSFSADRDTKKILMNQFGNLLRANRKQENAPIAPLSLAIWMEDSLLKDRVKLLQNQTEILSTASDVLVSNFFLVALYGYVLRLPLRMPSVQLKA